MNLKMSIIGKLLLYQINMTLCIQIDEISDISVFANYFSLRGSTVMFDLLNLKKKS